MNHLLLITTSYPDESEGAAAAGTFVRDFAHALSAAARVTVVAPGAKTQTCQEHPAAGLDTAASAFDVAATARDLAALLERNAR